MRKSYKRRRPTTTKPLYRTNERIRAHRVKLIDENGQTVGVVDIEKARQLAREAELDLVEVSPKADPPVVKILNYGQFKYKKEKELKMQKLKQKVGEIKGIRLSFRIGKHDKEVRLNQAKKFLEEKDKIKIELILRGRERQHINQARAIMENFVQELGQEVKIEQPFNKQGGKLSIVVAPKS